MCGIAGAANLVLPDEALEDALHLQHHRGPDARGSFRADKGVVLLHNRLSILDLSDAGQQPMQLADTSRYTIVFNGEIYNYLELKQELKEHYTFKNHTDTEVLLAAYAHWGQDCLHKLIGMFAFAIYDEVEETVFLARDRFGVKPLYLNHTVTSLAFASEIKTLSALGVRLEDNETVWASYLVYGHYGQPEDTFYNGIKQLRAGHCALYKVASNSLKIREYYDFVSLVIESKKELPFEVAQQEYETLLQDSVAFRFRADVPVGINISGGLDSSALLYYVDQYSKDKGNVKAFTFFTGDERYDELPWVEQMISFTNHELVPVKLQAEDVPMLYEQAKAIQEEPFGGIPTLAYSKIFKEARERGVLVLLDGQGIDEQLAGYDYYRAADESKNAYIQGAKSKATRPGCYNQDLVELAHPLVLPKPFNDPLLDLQYRDIYFTKIPRALRFNDRVSMMSSVELREPFLDHRLFELAFMQPNSYKIKDQQGKWLLRELLKKRLPSAVTEAPKRPLQTPQREWLREDLQGWVYQRLEAIEGSRRNWIDFEEVESELEEYNTGSSDNSFYIWQWISLS